MKYQLKTWWIEQGFGDEINAGNIEGAKALSEKWLEDNCELDDLYCAELRLEDESTVATFKNGKWELHS